MSKEEKKMGRPSAYSEDLVKKIIELTANSSSGLKKLCKNNDDLPDVRTIRRWLVENEAFRHLYARAKEEQADFMADEIIDISDELESETKLTNEKVAAARLRVDSRKWVAAKLKPKKYGDKTDLTTDGESLNKGFADFLKEVSRK